MLHHPLELPSEVAEDEEDVEHALMVADEDVRLALAQVLAALNADGQEEELQREPSPCLAGVVAEPVADDDGERDEDRPHDEQWDGYEELIELVECFHADGCVSGLNVVVCSLSFRVRKPRVLIYEL